MGTFSRRTLAKGAAWTAPAVAVAGAAPAYAASVPPEPGLQGWVLVTKTNCSGSGDTTGTLTWDSAPNRTKDPDPYTNRQWGLWVWSACSTPPCPPGAASDWTISGVTITVYLPSNLTISNARDLSGNNGWSVPTRVTPSTITGTQAWQTTYSGTFSYVDDPNGAGALPTSYFLANGTLRLAVDFTGSGACGNDALVTTLRRCVTVDTKDGSGPRQLCFNRTINI